MRKGDLVIADHPESESSILTRFYGIITEISETGRVKIELADGTVITRQSNSVAVFIHPPSNWQELFELQEVLYTHPRHLQISPSNRILRPRE